MDSIRATNDCPVSQEDVEDIALAINDALARMRIEVPVPFTFARLGAADRARVPGLYALLYREDPFDARDLIMGLVQEGGHKPHKLVDGASWLNIQLRGVSEADLRKWIARGREHYAVLVREIEAEMAAMECEEAERQEAAQRAEEARQARLEAARAQAEAKAQAKAQAEEDARQLVSAWVPTLDGVRVDRVRSSIRDEPLAFYIDVTTKVIRPARGSARPGEAKVFIQQSPTGPVLVNQ